MVFSIALIAILIAMVGVINTILISVCERFQEIGILKSIGALPGDIFALIWTETFVLLLLRWAAGDGLAYLLENHRGAHPESPPLRAYGVSHPAQPGARPVHHGGGPRGGAPQRHLPFLAGGENPTIGGHPK